MSVGRMNVWDGSGYACYALAQIPWALLSRSESRKSIFLSFLYDRNLQLALTESITYPISPGGRRSFSDHFDRMPVPLLNSHSVKAAPHTSRPTLELLHTCLTTWMLTAWPDKRYQLITRVTLWDSIDCSLPSLPLQSLTQPYLCRAVGKVVEHIIVVH